MELDTARRSFRRCTYNYYLLDRCQRNNQKLDPRFYSTSGGSSCIYGIAVRCNSNSESITKRQSGSFTNRYAKSNNYSQTNGFCFGSTCSSNSRIDTHLSTLYHGNSDNDI